MVRAKWLLEVAKPYDLNSIPAVNEETMNRERGKLPIGTGYDRAGKWER
jgi:hypothetical protein